MTNQPKNKTCSKCSVEKSLECYYKHVGGKYGVRAQCKTCRNTKVADYAKQNPEKTAGYQAKSEQRLEVKLYRSSYRKQNKSYFLSKNSEYRARKIKASPTWLSAEQKAEIMSFYEHAKDCKAVSGQDYEVDHIVPLKGKDICGLHVPWNLQVLPSDLNRKKSNKYETHSPDTSRPAT